MSELDSIHVWGRGNASFAELVKYVSIQRILSIHENTRNGGEDNVVHSQVHILLNVFLLPLLIPFRRCVLPFRSLSLMAISGASPPFSKPAANVSTPFRRVLLPALRPARSSSSFASAEVDGMNVISIPPSVENLAESRLATRPLSLDPEKAPRRCPNVVF